VSAARRFVGGSPADGGTEPQQKVRRKTVLNRLGKEAEAQTFVAMGPGISNDPAAIPAGTEPVEVMLIGNGRWIATASRECACKKCWALAAVARCMDRASGGVPIRSEGGAAIRSGSLRPRDDRAGGAGRLLRGRAGRCQSATAGAYLKIHENVRALAKRDWPPAKTCLSDAAALHRADSLLIHPYRRGGDACDPLLRRLCCSGDWPGDRPGATAGSAGEIYSAGCFRASNNG